MVSSSGISTNVKTIRLLVCLLLLSIAFIGCVSQRGEGFAIYLLTEDVPPSEMPPMSHLQLAERPIISTKDIVSYSRASHTMELTPEARKRIRELEVPTSGRIFVVAVDCQPIYWGAFWTPLSSRSFDGVTILSFSPSGGDYVQFQLGYPSEFDFTGEDPRSNPTIMKALEKSGKLKWGSSAGYLFLLSW
jgi:hypothetical protein